MKALVTGASGFIGSTLIEDLNTRGIEVRALMRKTSLSANLDGMKYDRVEGDLSDFESLKKAVAGVDYVFHLAGSISERNREGYFRHNAAGTERLARAVAEINPGLKRFVFVSSLAAGGPVESNHPRDEKQNDKPVSAYGESKLQAEQDLLKYKDVYPISVVRPPLVYGPKDKGVFLFIQTASRRLMPILPTSSADGHKYYSAIHSRDLCEGIIQAALVSREQVPSGEIFYLAGDGTFTYEEMMKTIAGKLGRKLLRVKVPKPALVAAAAGLTALSKWTKKTYSLNTDKLNELLPNYWICSNEKAKRMLGFTPKYDLNTGMSHAIDWYKEKKWI